MSLHEVWGLQKRKKKQNKTKNGVLLLLLNWQEIYVHKTVFYHTEIKNRSASHYFEELGVLQGRCLQETNNDGAQNLTEIIM